MATVRGMENQEVYTITIVRNIGIPISFTIKKWKVMFLLGVCLLFALTILFGSIHYLYLFSKTGELSTELKLSNQKLSALSTQIAKLDHDRYWGSEENRNEEIAALKSDILKQPDFSTEGIWITNKPTLSEEDIREGRAVDIERFKASVRGDTLKLVIQLKNSSNPPQEVGGYICMTLENSDQSPPIYESVTESNVGENGFPSSYKLGKLYNIKRRTRTMSFNFTLTRVNEYYTNVMIFIYSYKGRLLNRHSAALKKEIFLE